MTADIFAPKGWICPKCGRVLAPSTMYCLWCCRDMKESITTTGTSIPKWDTTPITVGHGMIDSSGKTDCDYHCVQTEVGCESTDCAWYASDEAHFGTVGKAPEMTDCAWMKGE